MLSRIYPRFLEKLKCSANNRVTLRHLHAFQILKVLISYPKQNSCARGQDVSNHALTPACEIVLLEEIDENALQRRGHTIELG